MRLNPSRCFPAKQIQHWRRSGTRNTPPPVRPASSPPPQIMPSIACVSVVNELFFKSDIWPFGGPLASLHSLAAGNTPPPPPHPPPPPPLLHALPPACHLIVQLNTLCLWFLIFSAPTAVHMPRGRNNRLCCSFHRHPPSLPLPLLLSLVRSCTPTMPPLFTAQQ